MKVVTIASRKGGGGKSTIARHLAVEATSQGFGPVCIVDADPMLGLAQWWSRREGDEPRLLHALEDAEPVTASNIRRLVGDGNVPLPIDKLGSALKAAARSGYKLCIIDTAPATDADVRACIAAADLVLMPVRPTQDDLDAIGETLKIAKSSGRPGAFVLNGAQKGAVSTRAAANALVHRGELAEPTIHRAEAIPATRGTGQTIGETAPASTSAEEFRQLWLYVAWRLGIGEQPEGILDIDTAGYSRVRKGEGGLMALGKRLTALEMPDEDSGSGELLQPARSSPEVTSSPPKSAHRTPHSIPLPPIPPAPRREIMVQLSIKAPLALVERLEGMTKATGAQKQAVMAAALDAYLQGHGY